MSEKKTNPTTSWHSETIETPKPKKIGRRDFLKAAQIAGGATLLALAGRETYKVAKSLGYLLPETPGEPAAPITREELSVIETQMAPTPTPFSPAQATTEPTREPVVQREGEFAGIIFREGSPPMDMSIFLDNKTISIPRFTPIKLYRGLYGDEFKPIEAWWRDGDGRMQLDGDSGWYDSDEDRIGFTFTPWQLALEENLPQKVRISNNEVDQKILNDFLGRQVILRQGQQKALVNIIAGARVTPRHIPDSKKNVANIVPWLAKTFPNHGFEQVLKEDPWKVLVIKFCGRNLQGEGLEESRELSGEYSEFRQARFFFVLKTK